MAFRSVEVYQAIFSKFAQVGKILARSHNSKWVVLQFDES